MAENRLLEWRTTRGWRLDDLADLSGISAATLSRVERGLQVLSPENQVALARGIGAKVRDIFPITAGPRRVEDAA